MPGLSLLRSDDSGADRRFDDALSSLHFLDDYTSESIHRDGRTHVGWSGYDAYPVRTIETPEYTIALEGYLYDTTPTADVVCDVVADIFADETAAVADWLVDQDAEFVLLAVEKASGDVAVLTDVLGRLPTYLSATDEGIALSRELRFVLETQAPSADSLGVAEMLLFGYPLGRRTLYAGVDQLPPASLVRLSGTSHTVDELHRFRFDRTRHADRSLDENADRLASLLSASCERRAARGNNVLSLSGGLDSRAIAACFAATDVPYTAATYDLETGTRSEEAEIAREVMTVLDGDWTCFDVSHPTGADLQRLLAMKAGMNYLGMGYILRFFDQLRDAYGPDATLFTGDGGDKIFPAHAPRTFADLDDVAEYVMDDAARLDVDAVAELTSHGRADIAAHLRQLLASYPATDPTDSYVQFLFRERGRKWLFHGEDRNRYYFWNAAPFWSWPMVRYAMGVPDEQKRRERLFARTIQTFSPAVAAVDYANFSAPITSLEYSLKRFTYDFLSRYPTVRDALVRAMRGQTGYEYDGTVADVLQRQATADDGVGDVLSAGTLDEIARDRGYCDKTAIYNVLTITSGLEQLDGDSTLDEFATATFE